MKFRNVVLVVDNVEQSSKFYKEVFNLHTVADFDTKIILSDGIVLQDKRSFENEIGGGINNGQFNFCLYFEENNMIDFLDKLSEYAESPIVKENIQEDYTSRKFFRILDPDGHMIEVGESFDYTVRRLKEEGFSLDEIATKTKMSKDMLIDVYGLEEKVEVTDRIQNGVSKREKNNILEIEDNVQIDLSNIKNDEEIYSIDNYVHKENNVCKNEPLEENIKKVDEKTFRID